MRRFLAVVVILLGVLVVPLGLSTGTSWLAVLGHLVLAGLCCALSWLDAVAGRPGPARGWGVWFLVVTGGLATALQVASWDEGGWGWLALLPLALWGWLPPATAWGAGALARQRERALARRAVRRRHARLA